MIKLEHTKSHRDFTPIISKLGQGQCQYQYLRLSLDVSEAELREQSFPPNPAAHVHVAVHDISNIVQLVSTKPDGSR